MPLIQDSHLMDSSSFFVQGPFNGSSDNLSVGTSTNVSPSHQATLNLNHSGSDSSIQQQSGSGSHIHHSFSNGNNSGAGSSSSNGVGITSTNTNAAGGGQSGANAERTSPLHLSTMLHSFSMGSGMNTSTISQQPQDVYSPSFNQGTGSYLLKMKNLPPDITVRETYAIFALADGVLNVELVKEPKFSNSPSGDYEFSVLAKFGSLPLATHYASILSSKSDIFGPSYPFTSYIEVIDEIANHQVSFQRPKFNMSQPNYQLSSSNLPPTPVASVPSAHAQQQQQASPVSSSGPGSRPGLMQTRLRFSFSDPFSNDAMQSGQHLGAAGSTSSSGDQHHHQQQNTPNGPNVTHTRSRQEASSSSSHSRDVGKSFLLMDNDDINDTIWGGNGIPTSMNGFSNTPQPSTPILDWGTTGRKPSSSFFLSQTTNSTGTTQQTPSVDGPPTSMQGISISNPTGSNVPPPFNLLSKIPSSGSSSLPNVMGGSTELGIASRKSQSFLQGSKSQQQNSQQGQATSSQSQVQEQPMSTASNSSPETAQKISQGKSGASRSAHAGTGAQKGNVSSSSSSSNVATGSSAISQADLSLLARVPPPANPADQNPPCNTLYVGNLPPDATEQELRQLFSGQQGFRRLSFRNKNSNGNGHGPMCFVEFEDVSFATRALAELYGSQLPRSNTSNKGGIRLSFSKNPLGVRGPNNRRGGSNTGMSSQNTNSNGNQSFGNYSYSSGYNKT